MLKKTMQKKKNMNTKWGFNVEKCDEPIYAHKKSLQIYCLQAPFDFKETKKAKGEEKPEEELMGKRKPSPSSRSNQSLSLATSLD